MTYQLAIIGAGNMAEAIARGVIAKNVLRPDNTFTYAPPGGPSVETVCP